MENENINIKTFDELGLSKKTLAAVSKKGFTEPTVIQAMTIPLMLKNTSNIIAQAQTGTGKTAAFGLPLIDMINEGSKSVQALILVPTRELAIQVSEEINSLKGNNKIQIIPVYGGQAIEHQLFRLKKGVHIVVGSPGRVIDHIKRGTLKLREIEHLILDEADEMLNMGFIEDMEEIMKHTNPDKRTLLFSATIPGKIKSLARKYMDGYELLKIEKEQLVTSLTEQIYFEVRYSDKFEALCRIIDIEDDFFGLIFCRTKSDVDSVATQLFDRGYTVDAIHGDISQAQRERTLSRFKTQRVNILVATDVAARGIDVNNLTHVINYSLPHDPESYVHRIGRTGRAGNKGTAITFITPGEYRRLMFIQHIARTDIKKSKVPNVEDIIKVKKKKIYDDLIALSDNDIDARYYNWSKELLENNNPTQIVAAMLNYCFEDEINPESYTRIQEMGKKSKETSGKRLEQHGKARLFVALGKKDKINAKKLVEIIKNRVSIESRQISDIVVMDKFSFVTVPFEDAKKIVVSFKEKGRRPLFDHVKDNKKHVKDNKKSKYNNKSIENKKNKDNKKNRKNSR